MPCPSTSRRSIELRAGEVRQLYLEPGDSLLLTDGSLLLTEAPQWVGETLLPMKRRIDAGEQLVATQRGWARIEARQRATLLPLAPAEADARAAEPAVNWTARWLQRLA